jgi:hypothetical protein
VCEVDVISVGQVGIVVAEADRVIDVHAERNEFVNGTSGVPSMKPSNCIAVDLALPIP